MRHGRAKAARKTLQYFKRTIGLKAPYSVLVDATFAATLFQQKILPVKTRIDRILQTNSTAPSSASSSTPRGKTSSYSTGAAGNKYFIMHAAVDELKEIQKTLAAKNHAKADTFQEALEWIKKECIVLKRKEDSDSSNEKGKETSTTKNSKKDLQLTPAQAELLQKIEESEMPYIVASQDEDLLNTLRQKGTVPIIRLANGAVLLLEQPSKQSQFQAKGMEQQKWKHSLPEAERALVELVREQERNKANGLGTENNHKETVTSSQSPRHPQKQQQQQQQRIKKAKGPNPLSCKRKQAPQDGNQSKESASKKRRKRAAQRNQKEDSGVST